MKTQTVIQKILSLVLTSLIFSSCSSGGDDGGGGGIQVKASYSSLVYSADNMGISGSVIFKVDDDIGSDVNKTITVEVHNFLVGLGSCTVSGFTVTPESLTYTVNESQTVALNVSLFDECFEQNLVLAADKTVTEVESFKFTKTTTDSYSQAVEFSLEVRNIGGSDVFDVVDEFVPESIYPDQNSFSLSVETFTPEAWNYNGVSININLHAADHFNNPVSDGTGIYFTTEGGAITSNCTTINGACTTTWTSMSPRPVDGRVTILATAIGSESFTDLNGNGLFDAGYSFTDVGEAFRDDNENGVFDADIEEFFDLDENQVHSSGNGRFNGPLCTDEAQSSGICTKAAIHVRDSITIIMATSGANIQFSEESIDLTIDSPQTLIVAVSDLHGNHMPSGTTVTVTASEGEIDGATENSKEFFVADSSIQQPDEFSLVLHSNIDDPENPDVHKTGTLSVDVTTPNGTTTSAFILITDID